MEQRSGALITTAASMASLRFDAVETEPQLIRMIRSHVCLPNRPLDGAESAPFHCPASDNQGHANERPRVPLDSQNRVSEAGLGEAGWGEEGGGGLAGGLQAETSSDGIFVLQGEFQAGRRIHRS